MGKDGGEREKAPEIQHYEERAKNLLKAELKRLGQPPSPAGGRGRRAQIAEKAPQLPKELLRLLMSCPGPAASVDAVVLDARGAQARKAVAVDRALPAEVFLNRQAVAAAGLLEREQATANRGDDLCLAPDHPAMGAGRRQICNREGAAIGPNDVVDTRTQLTGIIHNFT
jgi:hypothetical protein